jgi:hypothetical protein
VHLACERRQRDHLAAMRTRASGPVAVMRAMWKRLADPGMWPVYRLGFALRLRADLPNADQDTEREHWVAALLPLITALGVPGGHAADEALLWLATCRGLLWELITGADPCAVDRAASQLFEHYDTSAASGA